MLPKRPLINMPRASTWDYHCWILPRILFHRLSTMVVKCGHIRLYFSFCHWENLVFAPSKYYLCYKIWYFVIQLVMFLSQHSTEIMQFIIACFSNNIKYICDSGCCSEFNGILPLTIASFWGCFSTPSASRVLIILLSTSLHNTSCPRCCRQARPPKNNLVIQFACS